MQNCPISVFVILVITATIDRLMTPRRDLRRVAAGFGDTLGELSLPVTTATDVFGVPRHPVAIVAGVYGFGTLRHLHHSLELAIVSLLEIHKEKGVVYVVRRGTGRGGAGRYTSWLGTRPVPALTVSRLRRARLQGISVVAEIHQPGVLSVREAADVVEVGERISDSIMPVSNTWWSRAHLNWRKRQDR